MPDDKSKRGEPDSGEVSGNEEYEVRYFAEKLGLSYKEVRSLIKEFGNDRATLEDKARELAQSKLG